MANDWTRAMVADRLELAAEVMKSLPPVRPQGYVSAWPEYISTFADQVGQEPRMKKPLPSPRMITEADQALLWLSWLDTFLVQRSATVSAFGVAARSRLVPLLVGAE